VWSRAAAWLDARAAVWAPADAADGRLRQSPIVITPILDDTTTTLSLTASETSHAWPHHAHS